MCHLFLPLVSIFGLFPVLVSCHYELSMFQLCLCDCVNYPVYLVPVCSVWFRLVYSLLPGVSCLSALSCPALSSLKTIIWVYVLVWVFLFLPRVCTVTVNVFCKYEQILIFYSCNTFQKSWDRGKIKGYRISMLNCFETVHSNQVNW